MKKYTEKELLRVMIKEHKIQTIYLDNSQMKQLFNVSDRTLRRWRNAGKFPYERHDKKGKIYYKLHEVMNKMQSPS